MSQTPESARAQYMQLILAQMEKQGITKAQLCEGAGITYNNSTRLFNDRGMTFATAVRLARAVGMEFSPQLTETKL